MTSIRVYVNEQPVDVPAGSAALAAVGALDGALSAAVGEGRAYLTDGRGIRVAADLPLSAGAILRVVRPARRDTPVPGSGDADP